MSQSLSDYPCHLSVPLRFGDTDMLGHVNNAAIATLFESGRVAVIYDPERGLPPSGTTFVLAQIAIDFVAEINFPGTVDIGTGFTRIGNASASIRQGIFFDGRLCATATSTVVLTSPETRRSTPLPDAARETLSHYLMQE